VYYFGKWLIRLVEIDEPEWILEQARARKRKEMLRQREDMEVRLKKIRAKEKALRDNYLKGDRGHKKRKTGGSSARDDPGDEEQYVLEDYESDREESHSKPNPGGLSAETLVLMEQLGMITHPPEEDDTELEDEIKASETSLRSAHLMITDFLLLPHPLPTHTVHQ